jgi:DNA-binding MarR family transcriptional regulator
MPFDPLVSNAGRLRILAALASEPAQPFVHLRRATGLTDGNLATHARRLESAGLVAIEKTITNGKPLTTLHLTPTGRSALAAHARALLAALDAAPAGPRELPHAEPSFAHAAIADDWVD